MAFPAPGLYSRFRTMLPELLKFGLVGGLGTVIDLGGAALLHSKYHVEPLAAKAVSVTLATVFTYLGSRFWTFKERENQSVGREAVLFIVLNVIGLLIAEAVIGLVTYALGLRSGLEYNAASFIGTGLGTIFRFWAYRKWVFLAPEEPSGAVPPPEAMPAFPNYPPWELDPAFAGTPSAGAEAAAPAPLAALPAPTAPAAALPAPTAAAAAAPDPAAAAPDPAMASAYAGPANPPASPWNPPPAAQPQSVNAAPRPTRTPGRHRKT